MNFSFTPKQLTGETDAHITEHQLTGAKIHYQLVEPLSQLYFAAREAGFELAIASGFRSFSSQKLIWDRKWNGERTLLDWHGTSPLPIAQLTTQQKIDAILRWSALPGGSRHHWGTDLDIYASNLQENTPIQLESWEYVQEQDKLDSRLIRKAPQAPFYQWLCENMTHFHFFHPYRDDLNGIGFEPWHISYAPLSQRALNLLHPQLLEETISRHTIAGHQEISKQIETLYLRYIATISCHNTLSPQLDLN